MTRTLLEAGIEDVVVVVGADAEAIRAACAAAIGCSDSGQSRLRRRAN